MFTPIQETLLILTSMGNQLKKALASLVSEDRINDEDLKFTLSNHIHILLCSFLDEWKVLESMGQNITIQNTLKIASPAVKHIRKWKGLEQVRNKLLAHGQRHNNRAPAWPWEVFAVYDAPTRYAETILLGKCALVSIDTAFIRHQKEYDESAKVLQEVNRTISDKGIQTIGEIKSELTRIKSEMLGIARKISALQENPPLKNRLEADQ